MSKGADARSRCPWPGSDPLYVAYHDEEWGVPEYDSRALFEKLILDGFQAGLSWITILRKREAFREAFAGFDPEKIARFTPAKVEALMQNAGIVRNRAKILAAIASARAFSKIEETSGFAAYIWDFVEGAPVQNGFASMSEIPAHTPLSARMSKDLRARGFNFCGPTIIYAFCQACGLVNDHLSTCWRHKECAALARKP
ncbi:DNA-3-methyladenine glycosylase I [Methylocella silvestris]|uniref:DNA-3-methyladenine glycosylase I n=1 Tax=Methylocella silvestris TaxID=199596 RepID=A0A2J7TDZ0_METSI|nr:DNA-3-methyladenine glycosylase I [Methylocella silvestris]PNG24963.1 DNA-3-methyladenine glycosylase I [Methylocella silvestris]